MKKSLLNTKNFMWNFFAIAAVFTLVAFLMTLETGSNLVSQGLKNARIASPDATQFQEVAQMFVKLGVAVMVLLVSTIVIVPLVKFSLILVGLGMLFYAVKAILATFRG